MSDRYLDLSYTPSVLAAQERFLGRADSKSGAETNDLLGPAEVAFIESRDSFYIGTVNEDGWPYVQHRGGPPGFLRALSRGELGFADYRGNRQLLSAGNIAHEERVSLFLMDYPKRRRLKILGRAEVSDAGEHPELAARLSDPETSKFTERLFRIRVVAFDWNCPKYITPRFTEAEVERATAPLHGRIAELEARLAATGR